MEMITEGGHFVLTDGVDERYKECLAFAESIGKTDNFMRQWKWLTGWRTYFGAPARVRVSTDFAAHSFYFVIETKGLADSAWKFAMNGGVIFHEATQEWSVHS